MTFDLNNRIAASRILKSLMVETRAAICVCIGQLCIEQHFECRTKVFAFNIMDEYYRMTKYRCLKKSDLAFHLIIYGILLYLDNLK